MQINILEAIADALYSNAEVMIDAVSDLIETLLDRDAEGSNVTLGVSITSSVMSTWFQGGVPDQLRLAQQMTEENEKSRLTILSELVSAVGMQRFRFVERQSNGKDYCAARRMSVLHDCFAAHQVSHFHILMNLQTKQEILLCAGV